MFTLILNTIPTIHPKNKKKSLENKKEKNLNQQRPMQQTKLDDNNIQQGVYYL